MMEKISQRTDDDCTICVLAMMMGPPYTYERVLNDSRKYAKTDNEGYTLAWWKEYLVQVEQRPLTDRKRFSDLASLPGNSRAMLVFQIPHLRIGHIVAIDRFGVIDPQEHPASYRSLDDFVSIFKVERWRLYSTHFWLVQ